jgi:hypothetical protein
MVYAKTAMICAAKFIIRLPIIGGNKSLLKTVLLAKIY